jgi:glutathione S-transferase
MTKLIGSTTSPYVRKVRLLLEDQDYEFETLQALSPEGAIIMEKHSPIRRVPILIIDDKTLFDSSLICEYILDKKSIRLSIEEKLTLKLIDELCDSAVILFQQKIWDIDINWENQLSQKLLSRVNAILDSLEVMQSKNLLTLFQKDWLYCVLDWLTFRGVFEWKDNHPSLVTLFDESVLMDKFIKTKIE